MEMNRYKKVMIWACAFWAALNLAACGRGKEEAPVNMEESAAVKQESSGQTAGHIVLETEKEETAESKTAEKEIKEPESAKQESSGEETSESQQETTVQQSESAVLGASADELLDLFIDGSISAVDPADPASAFYITDLNMDSGEWDAYSVGERTDLDNDGENELILSGPYGGIYLDARDGQVYTFAAGEGNALVLSYTVYNGATWIMYSNSMNVGYESYHLERFEGADNRIGEMNFGVEAFDENNPESGDKYTLNGDEISYDEYAALCSKIFAAQVSTGRQSQ